MEISAVRDGIAEAVSVIPGLTCLGYMPGAIDPPSFLVGEVEVQFDQTMGRGLDELVITCYLFTSRADDQAGQQALDKHLSGSGPDSVKAALVAARGEPGQLALGGLAHDLHLRSIQAYGMHEIGDTHYYGASLTVRVWGKG